VITGLASVAHDGQSAAPLITDLGEWGMSTAERIAWGLLNLIVLIVLLRWLGTPEDKQKLTPPQVPKKGEEADQERADQLVGSTRASISLARSER
jgi:hypothetical protein